MADTPTSADLVKAKQNLDAYDQIINGDENTTVEVPDGGMVDSVAKAIASIAEKPLVAGEIFEDTTAGLAATSDGDYFSVPSAEDDEYLLLYLNDMGSATLVKTYPSAAAIAGVFDSAYLEDYDRIQTLRAQQNANSAQAQKKAAVVILLGQSLNAGRGGTIAQAKANANSFMFNNGVHVSAFDFWSLNNDHTAEYDDMASVVELEEGGEGQSPCAGIASTIVGERYSRVYIGSIAVGARRMATLMSRGSRCNLYAFIERFCDLVRADGYEPEIMFYSAHGEADAANGTSEANYYDYSMLYYQTCQMAARQYMQVSDYIAPIFFTYPLQNSQQSNTGDADRTIAKVIERIARDLTKGIDCGPIYQWPANSDRVHPTDVGYVYRGEWIGQAMRDFAMGRGPWPSVRAIDLTWDGATEFVVTFDAEVERDTGMDAGTNLNTSFALDGLEWLDNGSYVQITNLSYEGRKIVGTLASSPSGSTAQQELRIAAQTTANTLISGAANHSGSQIRKSSSGMKSLYDFSQVNYVWANKQTITARDA